MSKNFLFGIVGLIIGLVAGFFGANSINREASSQQNILTTEPAATTGSPSNVSGGMLPDVAETLAKADSEPQNFAVQMRTGDMYARIGRFEQAVEFYKRGLNLKPDDFKANVVMANALFDSRQFEEAEKFYSKALDINPDDVNARTDLGTTFVERPNPDYDRAIREFKTALEVDPKHEPSLYYLGVAYFRKGENENARKALSELEKASSTSDLAARLRQNIAAQ